MYGLPFLYGWKWYTWAREFFESTNKLNFLCAGNQLSKSSSQIRKCIDWATNQAKWVQLWASEPNQFWYLYPSQDVVNAEFATKWKQFLPRGRYKEDSYYGWKEMKKGKDIIGIQFNSGVMVLFKTYSKNPQHLQTGTCYAIFCDEELPVAIYDELVMRINATDGYFCFTKDHLVECKSGLKKIQDISVGDLVLTREGEYKPVIDVLKRDRFVIKRKLSNGETLEGTPDHKIWTENRGYVSLIDLTPMDILDTAYLWKIKKILLSIKVLNIVPLKVVEGIGIIVAKKAAILVKKEFGYILKYGKILMEKFQKATSSTIEMVISKTITYQTLSASVDPSTQNIIIKKFSQSMLQKNLLAKNVEKTFYQQPLRRVGLNFVLSNVGELLTRTKENVFIVVKSFLLEKIQRDVHVLPGVQLCRFAKTVYNITVKDNPNYYISGINVSNCMVFTATLGQEFWRKVMEPRSPDEEELKGSAKWTVSAYDCMFYEDGTASHWTKERIAALEAKCKNRTEVLKRVYGRFVMDVGLKYPTFQADRHLVKGHPIPSSWFIYAGVDLGSGGKSGHPAAICFTAVKPDFKQARVFLAWRGDGIETTDGDIWNKYVQLVREHKLNVTTCYYDFASKDFEIIAGRSDYAVIKAEKGHEKGEQMINTMFKHDMVLIYENEETAKLANELSSLLEGKNKRACKDDLIDAFRYSISSLPIDFSGITSIVSVEEKETIEKPLTEMQKEIAERRKQFMEKGDQDGDIEAEFNYWNDLYN